jgi:guanyl-specific ribonuclease Sa
LQIKFTQNKDIKMRYTRVMMSGLVLSTTLLNAGWMDSITSGLNAIQEKPAVKPEAQSSTVSTNTALSSTDMNGALKQALNNGVTYAIGTLGAKDGYLNNPLTKILLPEDMQKMADLVKKVGGEKYVDDLVLSLNDAATEAAPQTAKIFAKSISDMSIDDAKKILSGSDKAATDYFRTTTTKDLQSTISPIVQKSMDNNSVAKYYDSFAAFYKENAGAIKNEYVSGAANMFGYAGLLPSDKDENLTGYVTNKSIDGIMVMIEEKEKQIRTNPLSQNSDLIGKVFSVFQ